MDYLVKISDVVTMLEELATKAKDLWGEYDDAAAFGVMSAYAAAAKQVKSIPPAQRWIPCSERLPEPNEMVLISVNGEVDADWIAVDNTGYGCWYRTMKYAIDIDAWMPLPEPYRGE